MHQIPFIPHDQLLNAPAMILSLAYTSTVVSRVPTLHSLSLDNSDLEKILIQKTVMVTTIRHQEKAKMKQLEVKPFCSSAFLIAFVRWERLNKICKNLF